MPAADSVTRSRVQLIDFLIRALADTPSEEFVTALFADEANLPDAEVNEPLDNGFERLEAFYEANRDRSPEAVWEDVVTEHAQLFLGGNPQVPSNETAYRDDEGMDSAAIAERYEAADWSPPEGTAADAITVELAFVQHLVARQQEDAGAFEAERAFLDDHVLRWVDDFAEEVYDRADSELYRAVASILLGVATFEAAFVAERATE